MQYHYTIYTPYIVKV